MAGIPCVGKKSVVESDSSIAVSRLSRTAGLLAVLHLSLEESKRVVRMTQWVKALSAKPENPS